MCACSTNPNHDSYTCTCSCHNLSLEVRMTAFDYFSPEAAEFRKAEAFRRPLIEKVIAQYGRGLITSVELVEELREINHMQPPPEVKRVTLVVEVNLDPVPGMFHDVDSARVGVQAILNDRIPHYKPAVNIQEA